MSETDDTDELLLIPPNFFLSNSAADLADLSSLGPYYQVVDGLITQVNNLEDRINSIEITSTTPSNSSLSSMFKSSPGKFDIEVEQNPIPYHPHSAQSTPQRPKSVFVLNSMPTTPHVDRVSPRRFTRQDRRTPPEKPRESAPKAARTEHVDDGMLGEIDSFISHVRNIKRLNAVRNLESDFNKQTASHVDDILKQMDEQHQKLEQRIRENEQQQRGGLRRGDAVVEPAARKERTWRSGDDLSTVPPSYRGGLGVRSAMYSMDDLLKPLNEVSTTQKKSVTQQQVPLSSRNHNLSATLSSVAADKCQSDSSSSESTQMTAVFNKYGRNDSNSNNNKDDVHLNALNVLNRHKNLLGQDHESKKDLSNSSQSNLRLVSLSHLWNSNNLDLISADDDSLSNLKHKLHEEKLRRKHCEQMIQKLQNSNLELQERLAVALKVDEAKDNAIVKFHDTWERMVGKVRGLSEAKTELEVQLSRLQSGNSKELDEANQKIAHYEEEASKALNLAHGNQEKLAYFEKHCTELRNEINSIERKYEELQRSYVNEAEKNKQFPEILAQKELELNENKNILGEVRKEVAQSKRAVEMCQVDFASMKRENAQLEATLQKEIERGQELSEQKNKLMGEIDAHKNSQKVLRENLKKAEEKILKNQNELKNFYQGQLELVVQNKVKEFQNQLDQAQASLKEDSKKRELTIAKNAALHIQQISDKCSEEIRLLEEKHREETRLHQLQLSHYRQQIDEMNMKFQRQQDKRALIDRQLIKFMESLQADQNSFNTIDQLNSFKSKSFHNLEEILSQNGRDDDGGYVRLQKNNENRLVDGFSSAGEGDGQMGAGGGQSTYRLTNTGGPGDGSVGSGGKRARHQQQYTENEFQKFLSMVYNQPPGTGGIINNEQQPVNDESTKLTETLYSSDRSFWHQNVNDASDQAMKGSQKERRYDKPPWK